MKKQHAKLWIVLMILLVLNLIGTGTVLYKLYAPSSSKEQTEYELYIGTNDKDTYQSEIPYDECVSKVTDICLDHVDSFTVSEARGVWKDDTGTSTYEKTIVCHFDDVSEEQIHAIADDVLTALNQNSILIEKQNAEDTFYTGQ
jgi:hypothetical protein